jgi:hypothetical protein
MHPGGLCATILVPDVMFSSEPSEMVLSRLTLLREEPRVKDALNHLDLGQATMCVRLCYVAMWEPTNLQIVG